MQREMRTRDWVVQVVVAVLVLSGLAHAFGLASELAVYGGVPVLVGLGVLVATRILGVPLPRSRPDEAYLRTLGRTWIEARSSRTADPVARWGMPEA